MLSFYIDYILIDTKNNFADHLKVIDKVLHKRVEEGLKVNS